MPEPSTRRRLAGLLVALAVVGPVALVVGAPAVAAGPQSGAADPSPAAATGCGPAPTGKVAVMMVVDRGAGTPSARCVTVEQGATGLDALRAAGFSVRLDGGFVCGIDGVPATGCGNVPGSPYWSYWHAPPGGDWTYSQVGAGGYRLPARCAIEGWVWSDTSSARVAPRLAPPPVACSTPPTTLPSRGGPSTTVPSLRPPSTTAPGTGPGAVPPTAAGPAPSGESPTAPGGGREAPRPAAPPGESGEVSTSTVPVEVGGVSAGRPTEATGPPGAGGGDGGDGAEDVADPVAGELALAVEGAGTSSAPWGTVAGVGLILALGTAALWRARARREGSGGAV